jgi:hypothetical protein
MPPVVFELAIPGSERHQAYTLDSKITGIGL